MELRKIDLNINQIVARSDPYERTNLIVTHKQHANPAQLKTPNMFRNNIKNRYNKMTRQQKQHHE